MAAVEHQDGRARALILTLHDHQILVRDANPRGVLAVLVLPLDGVQQRGGGVEVERVAELVGLRRTGGLDTGRLLTRVVAAVAALAERAEQIAQRAVAEEVERLVGDFEGDRRLIRAEAAAPLPALALGVEIRRRRDVAFLRHPLDDLLNQFLELRPRIALIRVGRIAEQPLDRFLRQHAAVEQRVEDRVVQRLHRPILFVHGVGIAEAARQQQIRRASTPDPRDPARRARRR